MQHDQHSDHDATAEGVPSVLDCGTVLTIAGGILLAALLIRAGVWFIDWLDARTSHLSEDEARSRAKLAMMGKWPPKAPSPKQQIKVVAWTWGIIGLLLAGLAYLKPWR